MSLRTAPSPALKAEDVAAYLAEHKDFFLDHEDLLMDMQLRHRTGRAVSLIERQVADLRQRNSDLRHRLSDLLARARHNDQWIEKTRRLTLALLDTQDLGDLVDALAYNLTQEFGLLHHQLILFTSRSINCNARMMVWGEAQHLLGRALRSARPWVSLSQTECSAVFTQPALSQLKASLVVLRNPQPIGALALATGVDAPTINPQFLLYLGQLLERLLPAYLQPKPT